MKKIIFTLLFILPAYIGFCQKDSVQIVEAACGECQFGLKGQSCDFAMPSEKLK